MTKRHLKITDLARDNNAPVSGVGLDRLLPLPPPYDKQDELPEWKQISEDQKTRFECTLDGIIAVALPKLRNKKDEKQYVEQFVAGLKKLLDKANNWTFLQPLLLSLEYCSQCQTCSDSCHVYLASGKEELYRPVYRSEVFRRLVKKYARPRGKLYASLTGSDIELNWALITRLFELSFRCNLCRRCAQACPMSIDNALITRELRKLFSQELGWSPHELHEKGTLLQIDVGSPTGMKPHVARDNIQFLDEDFTETTGFRISTPWDRVGADVLLIHSAGDILAYPESVMAFAIICNAAGISWTLSSDAPGYDGVNYGLFYDDIQFARIAVRHAEIAKKLKVRKVVLGECGHQHKAFLAVADRILTGDLNIRRESAMTFLENIVFGGRISFDPLKNNFPVTLHDPCNLVRNLGIVEPQRRILRYLCPQFREMAPQGIDNYCCGGGGGLSIMSGINLESWKVSVAGRMKFKQVLAAFSDQPGPEVNKYVCAPCLNCKLQFRSIFAHYGAQSKSGLFCGGLAELIVNAMTEIKTPFIQFPTTNT